MVVTPHGLHISRKAGIGYGHIVLHLYGIHIAVRTKVKLDTEAVTAGIISAGAHVIQSLGTIYLIFNDLRHRIIDDTGIGPGIGGTDRYGRGEKSPDTGQ